MAETFFGEVLTDADASNQRVFQRWTFGTDVVLERIRCKFLYFNNPSFTSINFKVYSLNPATNLPSTLLFSSDSRTKTDITADVGSLGSGHNYGVFETYFDFSDLPALSGSIEYGFVCNGVWSGFTTSSHLQWLMAHPDYPYGGAASTKQALSRSFFLVPITAEL